MDIQQAVRSYASQPLTHQLLLSLLKDYKSPNDKISSLLNGGVLTAIKKGLYIAGPVLKANKPEPFLMANQILGPSYISLDSALSYYGIIPERVYKITSVTVKSSRKFVTAMGLFSYTRLPLPYYAFGIQQKRLSDEQYVMMASPEKALFDKVITTSGMILRSKIHAYEYLLENLRMDEAILKSFDTGLMLQWLQDAPKKESLAMVIKAINNL